MYSRISSAVTGFGALFMFAGLCLLLSATGKHADNDTLGLGFCSFSFGALAIAGGIYLKASAIKSSLPANAPVNTARKVRGGCELCAMEIPVVQCRKHELHLCGNCLAQHYDSRTCVYVPSARRTASKSAKGQAAKASWA